jgi:hypothetical protein
MVPRVISIAIDSMLYSTGLARKMIRIIFLRITHHIKLNHHPISLPIVAQIMMTCVNQMLKREVNLYKERIGDRLRLNSHYQKWN